MADNILQRIIKLILDRDSARKAQSDIESMGDKIENKWKEVGKRIGEFLAAAFAIEKLFEFGKESIRAASEAQLNWAQLKGTIDATGASFDSMEESIRATAEAFQDATIHDEAQFAQGLTTMIARTGDVSASLNNMGLVANVAAEFFRGDLEPAISLVSKVMNGNVIMLQRMGIHAKDAQDGLNILAQRSMGAATREAQSFGGQLKQVNNAWEDFKRDVGFAIIGSDGATNALGTLRGVIKSLSDWVARNKDNIRVWVKDGVAFAIDATDVLTRAVLLVAHVFEGILTASIMVSVGALGWFIKAIGVTEEASVKIERLFGAQRDAAMKHAEGVKANGEALIAYAKAAGEVSVDEWKKAWKNLTVPLWSSDQFKNTPKPGPLPGGTTPPMVSKNATSDATKDVEKAIEEFKQATLAADNMQKLLGDKFDSVGADIDRTTKLLNVLTGNGIDPATVGFAGLADHLKELTDVIKPTQDATKALAKSLGVDVAVAALTSSTGLEDATTRLDLLRKKQGDALTAFTALVSAGIDPSSAAAQKFADQYRDLSAQIGNEIPIQAAVTANKELTKSIGIDLVMASATGAGSLEILQQQLSLVGQKMVFLLENSAKPTDQAFLDLVDKFNLLSTAIQDASDIQNLAQVLRDFGDSMRMDMFMATVDGTTALERMQIEQRNLAKAMSDTKPANRQSAAFKELQQRYKEVTAAIKEQTIAMQFQATIADLLADILGTAMQGGIASAARQKAKQDAIEAAEMLVRAGVFALFGNAPAASAALVAAGQFTVLAAAWGALAAASGGGGGGGGSSLSSATSGIPSGGQDLSSSRASSSQSAASSTNPSPEVSIYLVGPGFNALNPEVQRVVWGAQQQATERYGPNAKIRIRSTGE